MKQEAVARLHADFEKIVQVDAESGIEFWYARDLQQILGYTQWRSFEAIIDKAVTSCQNSGYDAGDHFARARKMVYIGSGAQREVEEIALTRYACYLIAQNGDPGKEAIAFAQSYFAVQTRKQELIAQRLVDVERLDARKKLTESERQLSGIIFERLHDSQSFGRIRSKGDQALFGHSTQEVKKKLGIPAGRPLADFLPTISIKAKDFANEITNFNVEKEDLSTERAITAEHIKNNDHVRNVLISRGIRPEALPPAEDIKAVERRRNSEDKKLTKNVDKLPRPAEGRDPDPPEA